MERTDLEQRFERELLAEAAMCVWECWLENKHKGTSEDVWQTRMTQRWKLYGTVDMRHFAYTIGIAACAVYEDLKDEYGQDWFEENDLIPYDWEFIPVICSLVDYVGESDNSPEALKRRLLHKLNPPEILPDPVAYEHTASYGAGRVRTVNSIADCPWEGTDLAASWKCRPLYALKETSK